MSEVPRARDDGVPPGGGPVGGARRPTERNVQGGRLWAGGAATALVAALTAFVGVLLAAGVFDVELLTPTWLLGDSADLGAATRFALTAAVSAVLATALLHLLLLATPQPVRFFSWIVGLVTAAAAVAVLALDSPLGARVATATIVVVVGAVIVSLLDSVALRTAGRR